MRTQTKLKRFHFDKRKWGPPHEAEIQPKNLTVQVVCAIIIGILFGHYFPELGEKMKVLADGFIKLIKMVIAPIVFFTVVNGIANMGDMKKSAASAARRCSILKL